MTPSIYSTLTCKKCKYCVESIKLAKWLNLKNKKSKIWLVCWSILKYGEEGGGGVDEGEATVVERRKVIERA